MAAMSDWMEGKLIDHIFRTATYTKPTNVYIALFDTTASLALLEAGTLTGEISGNAYARQTVSVADASWAAPSTGDGVTSNLANITFPTATPGNWGTIRYAAVMDASTAGNVMFYGQLSADKTINNGDTFQFNIGNFSLTFA